MTGEGEGSKAGMLGRAKGGEGPEGLGGLDWCRVEFGGLPRLLRSRRSRGLRGPWSAPIIGTDPAPARPRIGRGWVGGCSLGGFGPGEQSGREYGQRGRMGSVGCGDAGKEGGGGGESLGGFWEEGRGGGGGGGGGIRRAMRNQIQREPLAIAHSQVDSERKKRARNMRPAPGPGFGLGRGTPERGPGCGPKPDGRVEESEPGAPTGRTAVDFLDRTSRLLRRFLRTGSRRSRT